MTSGRHATAAGRFARLGLSLGSVIAAGLGLASVAAAAPVPAPPAPVHARTANTADGPVTVSLSGLRVNPVPNLTGMPFSREGFVSAAAKGAATGDFHWSKLETGYQVGCAVFVPDGVSMGVGPTIGFDSTGPTVGINPSVSVSLKPGTITDIALGQKELNADKVGLSFDQVHLKIDGCLGAVSIRPYAIYTASTGPDDHTVAVYGPSRPF